MAERHPSLRSPLYTRLFGVLLSRSSYPADFNGWDTAEIDEDEFERYRLYSAPDIFVSCAYILREQTITGLRGAIEQSGSHWIQVEACLFSLGCLAPVFTNHEVRGVQASPEVTAALAQLLSSPSLLGGSLNRHPLVVMAMGKVVQSYSAWIATSAPHVLNPSMLFCLETLTSTLATQHTEVALSTAKAFGQLCIRCQSLLGNGPTLQEIVNRLIPVALVELDITARILLVEALGRLSVLLPPNEMQALVQLVNAPNTSRIQHLAQELGSVEVTSSSKDAYAERIARELKLFASTVRYLEITPEQLGGQTHPVVLLLSQAP